MAYLMAVRKVKPEIYSNFKGFCKGPNEDSARLNADYDKLSKEKKLIFTMV